jgi:hypothetical protein
MGAEFDQEMVEGGQGQQPLHQMPGGGITAWIQAATSRHDSATIKRELNWQARVEGNVGKSIAFHNQALIQQVFRTFAFMKGKLPVVHMAHSVGTFFGMSGLSTDVQGKYIGFIGDRGNGRYLVPFILLPQNLWAWLKTKYLCDTAAFGTFYADDDNRDNSG